MSRADLVRVAFIAFAMFMLGLGMGHLIWAT